MAITASGSVVSGVWTETGSLVIESQAVSGAPAEYMIIYHGYTNCVAPTDPTSYLLGDQATNLAPVSVDSTTVSAVAGWSTEATSPSQSRVDYLTGASTTISSTLNLWPVLDPQMYTITFDSGGGTSVTAQIGNTEPYADLGLLLSLPTPPTRSGFVFTGWHYTSPAGTSVNWGVDRALANITLYASWLADITVTFNSNGGSAVPSQVLHSGGVPDVPNSPTKTGYWFQGWYLDAGLTTVYNFNDNDFLYADTTLYAKYTILTYRFTYNYNGGDYTGQNYIFVNYGAYAPDRPFAEKPYHTFLGWFADIGLTTPFLFASTPIYAITNVYAKWAPAEYTLTFETNGGSAVAPMTVQYGVLATPPSPDPTRPSYTFAGWFSDAELLKPYYSYSWYFTSNRTIYAGWTLAQSTVHFETNGGTSVPDQVIAASAQASAPTSPTKTAFVFAGWYSDSGLVTSYNFSTPVSVENLVLYAAWTNAPISVTFVANGGSETTSQILDYNTAASKPTPPTKTGKIFHAWFSDAGLTFAHDFKLKLLTDVTLYAGWVDSSVYEWHSVDAYNTFPIQITSDDPLSGDLVILTAEEAPVFFGANTPIAYRVMYTSILDPAPVYPVELFDHLGLAVFNWAGQKNAESGESLALREFTAGELINPVLSTDLHLATILPVPMLPPDLFHGLDGHGYNDPSPPAPENPLYWVGTGYGSPYEFFSSYWVAQNLLILLASSSNSAAGTIPHAIGSNIGWAENFSPARISFAIDSYTAPDPMATYTLTLTAAQVVYDYTTIIYEPYSSTTTHHAEFIDNSGAAVVAAAAKIVIPNYRSGDWIQLAEFFAVRPQEDYYSPEGHSYYSGIRFSGIGQIRIDSNRFLDSGFMLSDQMKISAATFESEPLPGPADVRTLQNVEFLWKNNVPVYLDVIFNSNGGTVVDAQLVLSGDLAIAPVAPTRINYDFNGWCTTIALDTLYDFSATVSASFTLYARWKLSTPLDPITVTPGISDPPVIAEFTNIIFPESELPGLMWDRVRTPIWETKVHTTSDGYESRTSTWSYPRYKYELHYELLREDDGFKELQLLLGLFLEMKASQKSFLYRDPDFCTLSSELIATADGTQAIFRVVKISGNCEEPIGYLKSLTSVKINGVEVDTNQYQAINLWKGGASIWFNTPPAPGSLITVSGTYMYRVRFMDTDLSFTEFAYHLWEAKKVVLITTKELS